MNRLVGGIAIFISLAPVAICFFYPIAIVCFSGFNLFSGIIPLAILSIVPVLISVTLLLLCISTR